MNGDQDNERQNLLKQITQEKVGISSFIFHSFLYL